jgi:pimeloyl-ACP methyl ester carboxylesterase
VKAQRLDTRVLGSGPRAVLVHGGAGPRRTWELQEPLAKRRQLVIPSRRGFDASPPTERQDFDDDAADLLPLLSPPAHLVGFSYGGLGALIAAARRPDLVTSLTIIETPLFAIARGDAEVERFERLSNEFLAGGLDARPEVLEEFLPAAALPTPASGSLPADVELEIALARGGRPPGEASPDLEAIRRAALPVMVVSGDHLPALERLCDLLAAKLGGERAVLAGRGHAIPRAEGFNDRLEAFWSAAEANLTPPGVARRPSG